MFFFFWTFLCFEDGDFCVIADDEFIPPYASRYAFISRIKFHRDYFHIHKPIDWSILSVKMLRLVNQPTHIDGIENDHLRSEA